MLRVNTIYPAFMGEVNKFGIGAKCTFLRLSGCNLRCYLNTKGILCDTPEALCAESGKDMLEDDIVEKLKELGNSVICITGGEPLLQDISHLLELLRDSGMFVVIETNGSISIEPYKRFGFVSFVVDRKSLSSGELPKMCEDNYKKMGFFDYLKFVVDTEDDYTEALDFYRSNVLECRFNWAVGLFWGSEVSYSWLIRRMHEDKFDAYVNMQTHKMACLYDDSLEKDSIRNIIIPRSI